MAKTPETITVRVNVEEVRPSCGGKSIMEMLWERLDEIYVMLMGPLRGYSDGDRMKSRTIGEALGIATAIAIIMNPYAPNVDAVRAEARSRWEASQ
jgi:hypothetical protein